MTDIQKPRSEDSLAPMELDRLTIEIGDEERRVVRGSREEAIEVQRQHHRACRHGAGKTRHK